MAAEESDTEGVAILREGFLESKKTKKRYYILTEGTLFSYKGQMDKEPCETIQLKDASIKEQDASSKMLVFTADGVEYALKCKDADRREMWQLLLEACIGKDPSSAPERDLRKKKSGSLSRVMQQKAASSAAGKKVLRGIAPDAVWELLDMLKKFVTSVSGSKRAKELEKDILAVAIKGALLFRAKKLEADMPDLREAYVSLLFLWSCFVDQVDMEFARDADTLIMFATAFKTKLRAVFVKHLTPKTLCRLDETFVYCTKKEIIAALFDDDPEHTKFREAGAEKLRALWKTQVS
eukprot:CAMPEP_0177667828 /NCGR_PEP_ID=MMETSP0447-20121125/22354_1 /TAXON_ID=0 /ORGANISM="Stygamoeba regulata, Strain BSH-02190019" /LENGTH=293 /DNA_ID=CAMNT_0019174131 /DNA_START=30 /DNA_END=907 /DNA_ORIENTATION=+